MRSKIFLIFCLVMFPISVFGWISGSTTTVGGGDYDIRDIQNKVFDEGQSAWRVTGSSVVVWIDPTDKAEMRNIFCTSGTINCYFWDGTNWVAGRIDGDGNLWVETSTNSVVRIGDEAGVIADVDYDRNLRIKASTDSRIEIHYENNRVIIDGDGKMSVKTATDSLTGIYYNGKIAIVDGDGNLMVELSSNSITSLTQDQVNQMRNVWVGSGTINCLFYDGTNWVAGKIDGDGNILVETSSNSYTNAVQSGYWTMVSSDTLTHTKLQSILDLLNSGTTVYQGTVFSIKQELASSSTEYALTVSSYAVTTISGANWKEIKFGNFGSDYLCWKTGASDNVNVNGQLLDVGLYYIEDERYQGDFYLQAIAGANPLDIRVSIFNK